MTATDIIRCIAASMLKRLLCFRFNAETAIVFSYSKPPNQARCTVLSMLDGRSGSGGCHCCQFVAGEVIRAASVLLVLVRVLVLRPSGEPKLAASINLKGELEKKDWRLKQLAIVLTRTRIFAQSKPKIQAEMITG